MERLKNTGTGVLRATPYKYENFQYIYKKISIAYNVKKTSVAEGILKSELSQVFLDVLRSRKADTIGTAGRVELSKSFCLMLSDILYN